MIRKRTFVPTLSTLILSTLVLVAGMSAARAEPGFVGMQVQAMPEAVSAALDMKGGVLVRDVALGSPAAEAGFLRGDILIAVNGEALASFGQLVDVIKASHPGDTVSFKVMRAHRERDFAMTLGTRPAMWSQPSAGFAVIPGVGMTLASLTDGTRKQLGVPWGVHGVVVTVLDIDEADRTDLQRGEVILQINQQAVSLPDQVLKAYNDARTTGRRNLVAFVWGRTGYRFSLIPVE